MWFIFVLAIGSDLREWFLFKIDCKNGFFSTLFTLDLLVSFEVVGVLELFNTFGVFAIFEVAGVLADGVFACFRTFGVLALGVFGYLVVFGVLSFFPNSNMLDFTGVLETSSASLNVYLFVGTVVLRLESITGSGDNPF